MLTSQQRLAIFLHINGYSNTEMSAQIGVHPTTIRRWMRDAEFAQELKAEVNHAMARSRGQAQAAARRFADNACAAARATQSLLLSDKTEPRILVQCSRAMVQALSSLGKFLEQPAVVPLLEADDPQDQPGVKNPAPLICDTLREDELTTIGVMKRMLAETAPEPSKVTAPDPVSTPAAK
jgi:hypothetical protein